MEEKKHTVRLNERKELALTGIASVISFREEAVELESVLGVCQITGTALHMEKLDLITGEVVLTGNVVSLYYPDPTSEPSKGFFRRLFS